MMATGGPNCDDGGGRHTAHTYTDTQTDNTQQADGHRERVQHARADAQCRPSTTTNSAQNDRRPHPSTHTHKRAITHA